MREKNCGGEWIRVFKVSFGQKKKHLGRKNGLGFFQLFFTRLFNLVISSY
jgi:hypothetical protein